MAKAGKFAKQVDAYTADLKELFGRAIRQALMAGLVAAVKATEHDSSNAAAHWMIGSRTSPPGRRKFGKLRDLRGTHERPATPPVGKRRTYGAQKSATLKFVRERELQQVVDKLVQGRNPETLFYFFNAVAEGSDYGQNAKIEEAAMQAMQAVRRIFDKRIEAGKVRKQFR